MIDYSLFIENLIKNYHSKKLPGESAQMLMAPLNRKPLPINYNAPAQPKHSAVMALCLKINETPCFLLTERTERLKHHSKQISFPGGKKDKNDPDLLFTAYRELHEEVGIENDKIEVLGKLSPLFIPVSNFYVQPFLAIAKNEIIFAINSNEVSETIFLPVKKLLENSIVQKQKVKLANGLLQEVPAFVYNNKQIWGATAMILSEIKTILL
ncbi:MAG: CoA pyrophosphatase [Bacteroidia bacterium]|nr:CoA pyrophosphatase [Bacteroidia bacterium]